MNFKCIYLKNRGWLSDLISDKFPQHIKSKDHHNMYRKKNKQITMHIQ